jgi:hypothetical protein
MDAARREATIAAAIVGVVVLAACSREAFEVG